MDWKQIAIPAAAAVGGWILAKARDDLMPKKRIFTPRGTIYLLCAIAAGISIWTLVRIATTGNPIASMFAQIFLVTMSCIALVAGVYGYMILALQRRVTAIEQHVAPMK